MEGFQELDGLIRATGLHVARVMGMIWFLPVFGQGAAPRMQKIGLALVLGTVAATARGPELEDPGAEPLVLGLAVGREILFGLLLGWMAGLVFETARMAGALIATEMGLNLANQVDPVTGMSQPLMSQLFMSLAALMFFISDGHEIVLSALIGSFDGVPPGSFSLGPELLDPLLAYTVGMIGAGVKMAAPVFILLIVITVCVGFLAKVAPQLHILEASWPIRILSALVLTVLFLPNIMGSFDSVMDAMGVNLHRLAAGR
ncbi:MAG: hypothetical protein CMJ83_11145 [Planctomycetes bacterium]|nr:hypothetical protein [Planctomycetota bacterium]